MTQPSDVLYYSHNLNPRVAVAVARHLRAGQRQPLVLRAVGIPQREVLVVGPAVGAMDRIVVATVAAVGIAAGVGFLIGLLATRR